MSRTDTNQASEDESYYGVDPGIPGGDFTTLSIKKGWTMFTFTGDEAVAIIDLIRTEKLKLLAEVREQTTIFKIKAHDKKGQPHLYEAGRGVPPEVLTKLEAEL